MTEVEITRQEAESQHATPPEGPLAIVAQNRTTGHDKTEQWRPLGVFPASIRISGKDLMNRMADQGTIVGHHLSALIWLTELRRLVGHIQ